MRIPKFLLDNWEPALIAIAGILTVILSVVTFYANKKQEREIKEKQEMVIATQKELNEKSQQLNLKLKENLNYSEKIISLQQELNSKNEEVISLQQKNLALLTGGNSYPAIIGKIDGVFARFQLVNQGNIELNNFRIICMEVIDYENYDLSSLNNLIRRAINELDSADQIPRIRTSIFDIPVPNFRPKRQINLPQIWIIGNRLEIPSTNGKYYFPSPHPSLIFYCSSTFQQWIIILRIYRTAANSFTSSTVYKINGNFFEPVESNSEDGFVPHNIKVDEWIKSAIISK